MRCVSCHSFRGRCGGFRSEQRADTALRLDLALSGWQLVGIDDDRRRLAAEFAERAHIAFADIRFGRDAYHRRVAIRAHRLPAVKPWQQRCLALLDLFDAAREETAEHDDAAIGVAE